MNKNLILYYSIDELLKQCDIYDLLKENSRDSHTEFKTSLWCDNDIYYGEIIFKLDIKYTENMDYYSCGNIIISTNNNNIIFFIKEEGCKINILTNKYNLDSEKKDYQIITDYYIDHNNLLYGIIQLKNLI
jgi:hypothetical protein